MNFPHQRLILISGKGGVGKTTVAVALALQASQQGKKTLLVEMNSTERVAPFFNLPAMGSVETSLAPSLTGINLNPKACFEEYVIRQIHFKSLFQAFVNNRYVTGFLEAVPGLNDLLMIGKIVDFERQTEGLFSSQKKYDIIIVDAPATGHGLSAFEVPFVVNRAVKVGPLRKLSEQMIAVLQDSQKTIFCAVTLPEEMPVVETIEWAENVKKKLGMTLGPIFLNRYFESVLSADERKKLEKFGRDTTQEGIKVFLEAAFFSEIRSQKNIFYKKELNDTLPLPLVTLPFLDPPPCRATDLKVLIQELERQK